jgi:MraZ protein
MSRMEQLADASSKKGVFDNSLDDFNAVLFANARPLQFDVTGRIVIPNDLLKYAGIKNKAVFVGRGNSFQIWNPDEFRITQEKSLKNLHMPKSKKR